MKILVVLNNLDIGGAQNYTISLMNEFVKSGHTVNLKVLSDILFLKPRLDERINLEVWPRKKRIDIGVFFKIRNEIKKGKYDGVIASYILYQKYSTMFLKSNPITLYPIHTTIEKDKKTELLNYLLFKLKRKNEIFLTSIDNQTNYLIKRYHLKSDFFKQIYNGIDSEKFTLPPPTFNRNEFLKLKGIDPSNKVILMVAGFRAEKRHIDAIKAFQLLTLKTKDVSLVFVGDNRVEEANKLIEYTKKEELTNVHFFTSDTAGDIKNYYWSATIFTLTSNRVETFPISSLEAMASGLPCVLTNTGGAKDIIRDNENGIIVEPENIESISKGWLKCLQMKNDSISNEIRKQTVKNYSIKNSAIKYLEFIKDI